MPPIDARTWQILCLTSFLLLGVATRDWTLHLSHVAVLVLTCVGVQIGWSCGMAAWTTHQPLDPGEPLPAEPVTASVTPTAFSTLLSGWPSALITSLGLSLLLRADHLPTLILAGAAAISSKFLLRINGKHLFNPANFGIVVALICTQDAWVSPGQWGEEGWYALLFIGTGGLVVKLVGRWDTTIAFLATYAGLEAIRNVWLGWTWDVWLHRLMSGSLLLFALFMITDPRTIPNARMGRLIWAIAIALATFVLRNVFFVPTAVFWALFGLAPLSIVIDQLFPASRFTWNQTSGMDQSGVGHPQDLSQPLPVPSQPSAFPTL